MMNPTKTNPSNKNVKRTRHWLVLAAAAAAAPIVAAALPAEAQYRRENQGRELDASNRLGSGGFNDGTLYDQRGQQTYVQPSRNQVNPNAVITGNVTRGRE